MIAITANFWRNKRVLITGHTGFKGGWLTIWLNRLGAHVTGLSLAPHTQPSLFESANIAELCDSHIADITQPEVCRNIVQSCQPDIVIHLAAQALVRSSYQDPLATYATNVMGTANMLEAIRFQASTKVALMITTDKVYANQEWCWPYRETDPLGGHDPYSASKAACEIVIQSYRDAFFAKAGIALASARAGNVIGGGDWSKDRLIPDAIRAWQQSESLSIRHPDAIRPWQHVLEPLAGYLSLIELLWREPHRAGAYNFGPDAADATSVRDVIVQAMRFCDGAKTEFASSDTLGPHEAGALRLDVSLARSGLGVFPRWSLAQSLEATMAWYQQFAGAGDARALCIANINAFEASQ